MSAKSRRPKSGPPKPAQPNLTPRVEQLETQIAVLSQQIENVAKFLALGIASQSQANLTAVGAPTDLQTQLQAALRATEPQT